MSNVIEPVAYGGPASKHALAFKAYDKHRLVFAKPMAEWLRPAVSYRHSFDWPGKDMFGDGTLPHPWCGSPVTQAMADTKCDAAFEFLHRLDVPYFTFDDSSAIAEAGTLEEHDTNLKRIEARFADRMAETKLKLLWAAADLFSHPRYAAGAATNPDPEVFTYAAAQTRCALETTHRLGGKNYVVWGCREGYDTLLNTDLKAELDHLGRFLAMVVEHKHKIGFKGAILVKPKPFEPAKLQYSRDTAATFALLQRYGLLGEVHVSLEVNDATLAGLDFEHEMTAALACGIFGSIDVNRGDPRNGWATNLFPGNAQDLVPAMLLFLEAGGFTTGGFNFNAKLRRQSVDLADLSIGHVTGIDTLARALLAAEAIIRDKRLARLRHERYAGWLTPFGRDIAEGRYALDALAGHAMAKNLDPRPRSGKQEYAETLVSGAMEP